jgi:hypothetical protein
MAQTRDSQHLAERIAQLRGELKGIDPCAIAARTGAAYSPGEDGNGEFRLCLWNRPIRVSFPELRASEIQTGNALSPGMQLLLLYYFSLSDGTPQSGGWIAFSELPDGRFYNQAFQGYTGKLLAREFQNDAAAFQVAAKGAGGQPLPASLGLGDAAFKFEVLPLVSLAVAYWCGDEDFPASCQVLFDAAAGHHLSTDGCAILGSMLTQRILR